MNIKKSVFHYGKTVSSWKEAANVLRDIQKPKHQGKDIHKRIADLEAKLIGSK